MVRAQSVEVPGTAAPGSGAVRRSVHAVSQLTDRPEEGVRTIHDILLKGHREWPDKDTLGARHIVNVIEEQKEVTKKLPGGGEVTETKTWKFFELSGYDWYSWKDVFHRANAYGSGLRSLGVGAGDKLTIYSDTSRDWIMMALSASTQNITITTAYATLGEDGLLYSLQECEVPAIFTTHDLLPMISKIAGKVDSLKIVVYAGKANPAHLEVLRTSHAHLKVLSLDHLQRLGEETPFDPVPPKSDDLAMIMYTSGSTGPPKGVMITHANVVASLSGARNLLLPHVSKANDEVFLAYLPLAHILEFVVEMTMLYMGASIGYGSVKTLTDSSVRNCKGDIRELRPHILVGVPQVWESIRKAVATKLSSASPTMQKVFAGAFNLKWWLMTNGLSRLAAPLDAVVFSKIKDQVGGRLKFALSGGAPIPRSTHQFMNVAACIALVNGYGMTETTAVIAVQDPATSTTLGTVGPPLSQMEVKVVDVPEMGYLSTNLPKPQGEVWVRGPSVMKGYYKRPDLTAETMSEDGWLMTGDIAEWNADGTLSLIDRKKNLVKLSNGEYIALEKLESTYKVAAVVSNICVHADSEQTYAVALIFPIEAQLRQLAATINVPDAETVDFEELCENKAVRAEVLKTLKGIAKNVGFKPAEVVGQIWLCHEEWSPVNGLLTAAMKLQRKAIQNRYKKEIASMYM